MEASYVFGPSDVDAAWDISKKWFEYYDKKGPEPTETENHYEELVRVANKMYLTRKQWPTLGEVVATGEVRW